MTDYYAGDRVREAAALLRHRASRATPGPWRLSTCQYAALVGDQPHPSRINPDAGGWGWDDYYGGCLIAESMQTGDRLYLATMQPSVGAALADLLDDANGTDLTPAVVALADHVLGVIPTPETSEQP